MSSIRWLVGDDLRAETKPAIDPLSSFLINSTGFDAVW
jgi:hypothetical protein